MLWRAPLFQNKEGSINMGNVNMEASQINDRTGSSKMSVAQHLKALDAIASAIEGLPTFTSNDRAFLEELPAFPSEDGKKALVATTESGETSLEYEELSDLPADPETDGVRVLTASTTSGETVLSWEDKASNADYSTTEQATGRKWLDSPTYQIVIDLGEEKTVASNAWYTVGTHLSTETIINGFGITASGGTVPLQIVEDTNDGIKILQTRNSQVGVRRVWLEYTKSTT